jgi:signal transduction histidine kinase
MPPANDQQLATVVARLAALGRIGVVWLDKALTVTRVYGALAAGVEVGAPVTSGLVVLIGQEERIEALRTSGRDDASLQLPNVAVVADDAPPVRVDITVLTEGRDGYLVVIERVVSSGLAELVVEDEIRKRRIADAELARINRQLEEFAYVISHDLKAPMRALRYYSGDIADALAADAPDLDAARTAAANIQTATRRMSAMLVGLLEFSSVGRTNETISDVDTRALVEDIVASTGCRDGLVVTIQGDWPTIRAAATPMDLVLRNLIDNAIKYHDLERGVVRVIGREVGTDLVIDVADDGPGIPREWHKAIFDPFKRISDEAHPESSGIGLALVKRTLEAEGGQIEVLSEAPARRGTTFRVVWPRR